MDDVPGGHADAHGLPPIDGPLPRPVDDGAAAHLLGQRLPELALPATTGGLHDLGAVTAARLVMFVYPMTGTPGVALPGGWDAIPGARGCTPEACGFRDLHDDLAAAGAQVVGVSAQPPEEQLEAAVRLGLPYPLLSDAGSVLRDALGLPTFEVEGRTLLRRLTLVVAAGRIEHVFHPVFPTDTHADEVLRWLRERAAA